MITPRLEMILKNLHSDKIADIGTDHAYIPIELAKLGKTVIATDVNEGPLNNAKQNIEKQNLNISLRLGSGLKPINPQDADEIIIAGMGGELIQKIISEDYSSAFSATLLLQPMNSQAELREFLLKNGFKIISEDLAKEGFKIYNLIICKKGQSTLPKSEIELHLPEILHENQLFPMLLDKKKREFKKRYLGLLRGKSTSKEEILRLEKLLSDIENIEKNYKEQKNET